MALALRPHLPLFGRNDSGNVARIPPSQHRPRLTLPTMVRTELVTLLASRFPALTVKDAEAAVSVILTAIAERLSDGNDGRVEIRGFGTFTANRRPPRLGHNPATLAPVPVPEKYAPHFKPGMALRTRVAAAAKGEKRSAPAKAKEPEQVPGW